MLNRNKSYLVVLLIFLSLFTFQQLVSANIKLQAAEEYRDKGFAEHQKGNLNNAQTYYIKAISLGLDSPVAFNDMGILYEQIGLDNKAESSYLSALKSDKHYLPAYLNLAYLYQKHGDLDKAFRYFKIRYEMAQPGDPWAQKAKAELIKINPGYKQWVVSREAQKFTEELVQKAQKELADRVQRANEHYKRGQKYFISQSNRDALIEFNKALVLTPDNPKIIEARDKVVLEMVKQNIKEHSDQAIRMLSAGDSNSAKNEIQKMLTTIPR